MSYKVYLKRAYKINWKRRKDRKNISNEKGRRKNFGEVYFVIGEVPGKMIKKLRENYDKVNLKYFLWFILKLKKRLRFGEDDFMLKMIKMLKKTRY